MIDDPEYWVRLSKNLNTCPKCWWPGKYVYFLKFFSYKIRFHRVVCSNKYCHTRTALGGPNVDVIKEWNDL